MTPSFCEGVILLFGGTIRKKPLIGVVPLYDSEKESFWMLPGYMEGIEAAGGIPVMLPMTADDGILEELVGTLDGFLLTGGHDVDPALYGAEKSPACGETCPARDAMEPKLLRARSMRTSRSSASAAAFNC